MYARLTAPRGSKTRTIRALRAAGASVSSSPSALFGEVTIPADSLRSTPALLDLARAGLIRPIKEEKKTEPPARLRIAISRAIRALSPASLMAACATGAGVHRAGYFFSADAAVAEILRRVGPAGDQAIADEARYFQSFDRSQYESSKHSGRDWRAPSLAVVAPDGSAAIVCFVEAGSYLHKGMSDQDDYLYNDRTGDYETRTIRAGGLHHLRFRVFLVVRDATTGERHVLRIPPRFGRYTSATYRRYERPGGYDAAGLIHEATAWTFGLKPADYRPTTEA